MKIKTLITEYDIQQAIKQSLEQPLKKFRFLDLTGKSFYIINGKFSDRE